MPSPATIETARTSKSLDISAPGWSAVCMTGSRSTACSDFTEKEIVKISRPKTNFVRSVIRWRVARARQSQRLKVNLWTANFIRKKRRGSRDSKLVLGCEATAPLHPESAGIPACLAFRGKDPRLAKEAGRMPALPGRLDSNQSKIRYWLTSGDAAKMQTTKGRNR